LCIVRTRTGERKKNLQSLIFLGYTFKAMYIKCRDGKLRYNFIASVSKESAKGFRTKIKEMELHKRIGCKIDILAEMLNPILSGWMNYFGKYNPSAMKDTLLCIERRLVKWACVSIRTSMGEDAGQKNGSAL